MLPLMLAVHPAVYKREFTLGFLVYVNALKSRE